MFGALVLATIGAVFISQHLKVTTPLIAGQPTYRNTPHNIVPTNPQCSSVTLFFYLLHRADSFNVYIVDSQDRAVRTLASDVFGPVHKWQQFTWNGRFADGSVAPRGLYNFSVHLIHQNRTIDPVVYGFPISVQSTCPPA